jgi:hypothetical protein
VKKIIKKPKEAEKTVSLENKSKGKFLCQRLKK